MSIYQLVELQFEQGDSTVIAIFTPVFLVHNYLLTPERLS